MGSSCWAMCGVCIIITISGNEDSPQTSEQKSNVMLPIPPRTRIGSSSLITWGLSMTWVLQYILLLLPLLLLLSLSLSTLVERISKSSLNPRGPLTKTLGVLANPRGPDKRRWSWPAFFSLLAEFHQKENFENELVLEVFNHQKVRRKELVKTFCQIFYIWFWVCSQIHGIWWFIAKFG